MKNIWTVFCQQSIIDSETNNLSLLNVTEKLEFTMPRDVHKKVLANRENNPIIVPASFELVSLWEKEKRGNEKADILVELHDSGGVKLRDFIQPIEIKDIYKRLRFRNRVGEFPVTNSGIYHFAVSVKEEGKKNYKKVSDTPVEIIVNIVDDRK